MTLTSLESLVKTSIYNAVNLRVYAPGGWTRRLIDDCRREDWWEEGKAISIAKYCDKTGLTAAQVMQGIPCWLKTINERIYLDDHSYAFAMGLPWVEVRNSRLSNRRVIHRAGKFFVLKAERNGYFVYIFHWTHANKLGMFASLYENSGDKIARSIFAEIAPKTTSIRTDKYVKRQMSFTMEECLQLTQGVILDSVAEKAKQALSQMRNKVAQLTGYKIEHQETI